jgi:hypothetical protein
MSRGDSGPFFQTVNRPPTHFAFHLEPIVYAAKRHGGPPSLTLSFSLSRSAELNRNLTQYVPNA